MIMHGKLESSIKQD